MTKTVTSLFHNPQHAEAAARRLEESGLPRDGIAIWSTPHNLAPLLEDEGVSRTDAHAYAEGVLRGGSVVIVSCDEDHVDQVVGILDQEGVLDLDEQQTSWRSEGSEEPAGLAGNPAGSSRPAQAGPGAGYDLTGSPDMTRAQADGSPARQPDEVGHGRIRVLSRKAEGPAQK